MILLVGSRVAPEKSVSALTWPKFNAENLAEDLRMFYVYMLCRPDGTPFYVGKGQGNRAYEHLKKSHNLLVNQVIAKMRRSGEEPQVKIVFYAEQEDEVFQKEQELIAKYGRRNNKTGILCNLSDGGGVPSGIIFTPIAKARMSASRRGKKPSDSTRQKYSKIMKERYRNGGYRELMRVKVWDKRGDPEIRLKVSNSCRATLTDPSIRQKLSKGSLTAWADPETRAKHLAWRKGRKLSPEHIRKVADWHRGRKRPPATGQKISDALRKLNSEEVNHAFALREQGLSYEAIGTTLGVSGSTIHRILTGLANGYRDIVEEHGVVMRKPGTLTRTTVLTTEQALLALELNEQGLSHKKLAEYFGVSRSTIYRALKGLKTYADAATKP